MHDVPLDPDQLEAVWKQACLWSRVSVPLRADAMTSRWPASHHRVRQVMLIRAVYEAAVGPVPDGQLVFRTCMSKTCVNPSHMGLRKTTRWSAPRKPRRVA